MPEDAEDMKGRGEAEPLAALQEAIQQFANSLADRAPMVTNTLVAWEEVAIDDDGTTTHQIKYAIPTDMVSMGASLGLNEAAGEYIRRDILGARSND